MYGCEHAAAIGADGPGRLAGLGGSACSGCIVFHLCADASFRQHA